ncbi:hypothetical protein EDC94DRAFT_605279 [Helicostylum pulchrum]|nr:hypothetical protein EDC94DRAFT_605279 [Helicostylum pulchrum]
MTTPGFHPNRNHHRSYHNQQINQDEVEAGSILVALANHKPKTMSIHNLLESEHKHTFEPHDKRHLPSTPPNDLIPYKPDVIVDERMQTISGEGYFGHMHHQKYQQQNQQKLQHKQPHHHQQQQQQQQQQPHAYGKSQHGNQHGNNHRYHPYHYGDKKPATIIVSKQQQQQLPQNHHEFSRQYINMKRNPKIRRNALQAYISYMTYTDIARKRMKQGVHPTPTLSPPHAYQYQRQQQQQQQQQQHSIQQQKQQQQNIQQQQRYNVQPSPRRPSIPIVNKLIVDKPLTAFLHASPQQEMHFRYPPKRDTR